MISIIEAKFVVLLCTLLALIGVTLRFHSRKSPHASLLWMCISIGTWTALTLASVLVKALNLAADNFYTNISYLLSPISTISFTLTAGSLLRVREYLVSSSKARLADFVTWAVVCSAIIAFLGTSFSAIALFYILDAIASSAAVILLGAAIAYSFICYRHPTLAALTLISLIGLILNQFGIAMPKFQILTAGSFASLCLFNTMLLMLLAVWAQSEQSATTLIQSNKRSEVVVLVIDIRDSTGWVESMLHGEFGFAARFLSDFRMWVGSKIITLAPVRPSVSKFQGDGFLIIWQATERFPLNELLPAVYRLAISTMREYPEWAKEISRGKFEPPSAIGLGVDAGTVVELTFENGTPDFLGPAVNGASRLQGVARPNGCAFRRSQWNQVGQDIRVDDFQVTQVEARSDGLHSVPALLFQVAAVDGRSNEPPVTRAGTVQSNQHPVH